MKKKIIKIIISSVICSLLIFSCLYIKYYNQEENNNNALAIYLGNDKVESLPKKEENYLYSYSVCDDSSKINFNNSTWKVELKNFGINTSCSIYFILNEKVSDEKIITFKNGDYVNNYKVKNSDKVTLPETPTKYGYVFEGWYTKEEGGKQVTKDTKISDLDEDKIYARWILREYTITLKNAKFENGATSGKFKYGQNLKIIANIPNDYTESEWTGKTSCEKESDVGNVYYKEKHEYSVESWSVSNTTNKEITYTVEAKDVTITANIKDTISQVDGHKCNSYNATEVDGYYTCSSGDTLSGRLCISSGNSTYEPTITLECPNGGTLEGNDCFDSSCNNGNCEDVIYKASEKEQCRNGDSLSCDSDRCKCIVLTPTYDATYHPSNEYSCLNGGVKNGRNCYYFAEYNQP